MKFKNSGMRNDLLIAADKILTEEGIDQINIRHLSEKTGIATGTIYNYFSSKDEILLALTAEYWDQALEEIKWKQFTSFLDHVSNTQQVLSKQMQKHGNLIRRQIASKQSRGISQMKSMYQQLFDIELAALDKDQQVTTVWGNEFPKEKFIDFVLSQIIISLRREEYDMSFCCKILTRILYEGAE